MSLVKPTAAVEVASRGDNEELAVDDKAEIQAAFGCITPCFFCKLLELKGATLFQLNNELDNAVEFCRNYLDC